MILAKLHEREISIEMAIEELRKWPFESVSNMALVDHHRTLRSGIPEVVFGEGKEATQIASLMMSLAKSGSGALATRVNDEKADIVGELLEKAGFHYVRHQRGRLMEIPPTIRSHHAIGHVAIACAGTSDLPVMDEVAGTLEFLGHPVRRYRDIGVAGLPRTLERVEALRQAECVIVIAGMEGALPSVIAGLVDRPIIALPTSIGYGVGMGGFAAMLGMLSSCSPGVTVVNIDNGFGAAVAAALINRDRKVSE